ncbi:hypothetical protein [Moheibacter sp.]|uniref:hypothetical protein n=1 Tax=Moheibacter sp. TaxID=1965316 RepID=UPI003C763670
MENLSVKPPLTNLQAELLKLFSMELPEEELIELRKIMADFLLKKTREKADVVWDEKEYSDEKLKNLLENSI